MCFNSNIMRSERKKWSLGSDVDLLNRLETFSQNLLGRTCSILRNIDDFEKDLKVARLDVKTLSNTFEAVSDTQFVENRVYDEEEDVLPSYQGKEKDVPIATNINEKLEIALKTCSDILESKFEAVSIPVSDSDDDTDISNSEVIFIPKNKYKSRPLPHLIGGEEFYNDDSLGLQSSHNVYEAMSDNVMNGDETSSHSEISSNDEPDESSLAPEFSECKHYENEISSLSDSKENIDFFFINNQPVWKEETPPSHNGSISNKNTESHSSPEKTDYSSSEKTSSCFQNEVNVRSSIHEELKQLFKSDNNGENIPRLKKFEKTQQEINYAEKTISDVPTKSQADQKLKLSDDNLLPNVETEILHSFAKERAKIKGKRRLPSRRPRSIENDTSEALFNNDQIKENPILSPSTDEEDIFVLPQTQSSKEALASSLFMRSGLFSPGSSIEENENKLFPEAIKKEKDNATQSESNKNNFEEPLGVHKVISSEPQDQWNKQLFKDWDPFGSDESLLFPSIEKRNYKTKLFDDLAETSEYSSKDADDDLFSDKSLTFSSSHLFENNSTFPSSGSNSSAIPKKDLTKLPESQLFNDGSDEENDSEDNIFSKGSAYKSSFLKSLNNRNNDSKNPIKKDILQKEGESRLFKTDFLSDPLSDNEDDFFD